MAHSEIRRGDAALRACVWALERICRLCVLGAGLGAFVCLALILSAPAIASPVVETPLGAPPAAPNLPMQPQALCLAATDAAEARFGTPPGLLRAVSLVESGRRIGGRREAWPWTVNLKGAGHWFDTRAEALAFVSDALASGKTSFDVGCMQINYRWHGDAFGSVEEMFDPFANAAYAARFLTTLKDETGDWMRAAGYYHSRTPKYFKRYRGLIEAAFAAATSERAARRRAVALPAPIQQAVAAAAPPPAATLSTWPTTPETGALVARASFVAAEDPAWRGLIRKPRGVVAPIAPPSASATDADGGVRNEDRAQDRADGGLVIKTITRPAAGAEGLLIAPKPLL